MATEFADQVVLVTGAGGRIGRAVCWQFAREGARVACCDLDPARARAVADDMVGAGFTAVAVVGDVSDEHQVRAIVQQTTQALGPVDVLVNCAGIFPNCPVIEMDVAEWDRVFAVNVRGPMLLCREVARQMIARGAAGAMVNITSPAGFSARTGGAHYCGSKAALNLLTHTLAIELGPYGIRVNAVSPGLVLDEVVSKDRPPADEYPQAILRGIPMGRTGTGDDIAPAVLFAASHRRAGYMTGAIIEVTGGAHAGRPHLPPSRRAAQSV
ncbi:MAG: SDR family NAD(P)-dependent oxidoreductase [Armatimonadota bacterium]|nr:SDR family NAD(P)-dependent oxidoreductase [Armatimonadota bacterium]